MSVVITAGKEYVDIDVEACGVALYEIKRLLGEDVELRLVPVRAPSLPACVTRRGYVTQTIDALPTSADLILVDVSHVGYLTTKCRYDLGKIVEIYDHHFESIDYRKGKLGSRAVIDPVGSCATLIGELAVQHMLLSQLSDSALKLLYTAIVSNTLNFKARVTTKRDEDMARLLWEYITQRGILDDQWRQQYFQEVEADIRAHPLQSIQDDLKSGLHLGNNIYTIGQLELWQACEFATTYKEDIVKKFSERTDELWFITIASIEEGKNYLISSDLSMQEQLTTITGAMFVDGQAVTDRLWLRKEFIRELMKL